MDGLLNLDHGERASVMQALARALSSRSATGADAARPGRGPDPVSALAEAVTASPDSRRARVEALLNGLLNLDRGNRAQTMQTIADAAREDGALGL